MEVKFSIIYTDLNTNGENSVDETLLGKYFARETDRRETTQVEEWLSQPENRRFFEHLQRIWNAGAEAKTAQKPVDVDAAWGKMKAGMRNGQSHNKTASAEAKTIALTPPKNSFSTSPGKREPVSYWRIAAGILLVIGVGLSVYFSNRQGSERLLVTQANTTAETLADGSTVFLNRQSQLRLPAKFSGKTREVSLKGEAFFNVQRNENQPFIVHTAQVDIKVLGTSFKVKTDSLAGITEVTVKTGKVLVSALTDSIVLTKGQRAVFENGAFVRHKHAALRAGLAATFVFERTSLLEVTTKLNEVYGTNIALKNRNMGNCLLTVTFVNKQLDEVLQIIGETLELSVSEQQHRTILDGKGCK